MDFPRYFVAVTRVRQDSRTIGASGGSVKSSVSQAVATFPDGAISKDIKVGLQVSTGARPDIHSIGSRSFGSIFACILFTAHCTLGFVSAM